MDMHIQHSLTQSAVVDLSASAIPDGHDDMVFVRQREDSQVRQRGKKKKRKERKKERRI
jgi:hypothetical protein